MCELFGYQRIETPVVEHAGVWLRTSGDTSDIVQKEMYVFEDRGGDRLALRPEGTAGVMRAYLEHGMASRPQPVRLYYIAQNFRYDRPQAGRYRMHTQLGIEAIGDPSPLVDAEAIDVLWSLFGDLGLRDFTVKVNTIGDQKCRPGYVEALREFYRPRLDKVCQDCRGRFEKNPLRLLDCKDERCQASIAEAPRLLDHLCEECREHFAAVLRLLEARSIPYSVDERLVRGLDYYTRTVFEFHPLAEGAQSSMGSGGRYDGLVELMGGPPTPGVGFGSGIERIILNLKRQEVEIPAPDAPALYIAHLTPEAGAVAMSLAAEVRARDGIAIVGPAGRSLKAQMKQADARGARFVAIIGADEMSSGEVTLRELGTGAERRVKLAEVAASIAEQAPDGA